MVAGAAIFTLFSYFKLMDMKPVSNHKIWIAGGIIHVFG
jgi:hypothetical protein